MFVIENVLPCKEVEALWIDNVLFFRILTKIFKKDKQRGFTSGIKFGYINNKYICMYHCKEDIESDKIIYLNRGYVLSMKDIPYSDFKEVKRDLNALLSENVQTQHIYVHDITSNGIKIGASGL